MKISKNIKYIGVTDLNIDLFEGQYPVPEGMLYNSYIILDEKIAVLDTVDKNFGDVWFENLDKELAGRTPDYLVVHHMEPDHSANIKKFLDKYTNCKVLGSIVAFNMMKNFFGTDFSDRKVVVKDGDTLSLGSHTLAFVSAPLVHWPEVMFSYESSEKVLFSADAFGKFGCDKTTEDWACEARRYYFGIVGKFGGNVQNVLKKLSGFDIQTICPLHGPVLKEDLGYYLGLYDIWSKYEVETEAVTICYTSVYGNTKEAVEYLNEKLEEKGVKTAVFDLARSDMAEVLEDAFRNSKIVLATTTYNGDMFPYMKDLINHLIDHNYQNRKMAFIENGAWAPAAAKAMRAFVEPLKNMTYCDTTVTIKGAVTDLVKENIDRLVEELIQ